MLGWAKWENVKIYPIKLHLDIATLTCIGIYFCWSRSTARARERPSGLSGTPDPSNMKLKDVYELQLPGGARVSWDRDHVWLGGGSVGASLLDRRAHCLATSVKVAPSGRVCLPCNRFAGAPHSSWLPHRLQMPGRVSHPAVHTYTKDLNCRPQGGALSGRYVRARALELSRVA